VERRMAVWLRMPFPYGSEFAWDSTGHEEISTWMLRFGKFKEARQTRNAVLAYVSATPHWAYCGSARRWWDFTINGATGRGNERVMHHYAAALNSIPLFDHALREPNSTWLWRLAWCAVGGSLTNVRTDGSASMGFHGDPDLLRHDAFSADFGVGFYGHWKNAGAYLACSSDSSPAGEELICFGCDLVSHSPLSATPTAPLPTPHTSVPPLCLGAEGLLLLRPRDAFRRRVYLQPLGLLITSDGGAIESVELQLARGSRRAFLQLLPVPAGSTHALITLVADGDASRRVRLHCNAPCALDPVPFAGRATGIFNVRFGASSGARVEVSLTS